MTRPASGRRLDLFAPLGWALVRTPILPVGAQQDVRGGGPRRSLLPDDAMVRLAVRVASSDLSAALERTPPDAPEAARVGTKLLRYLIRMTTRPTPFGLFAGVGLVEWGRTTDLSLSPTPIRTRTRPDMEWLTELVASLEKDPGIRPGLRLVASSAVLCRAGRAYLSGGTQSGVSVRATGAVCRALDLARAPIPVESLIEELSGGRDETREKAERLVDELWRQGFFVSELRPPLTGTGPTSYLMERLADLPAAREVAGRFADLVRDLVRWDRLTAEDRDHAWPGLLGAARALCPASQARNPLQTDMALSLAGTHLHAAVGAEAARAAEILLRLSPYPSGPSQLDSYRRAYETRYGLGREVPLVELIDADFGLGPPWERDRDSVDSPPGGRHELLRDLALDAHRNLAPVLELDDELLGRLQSWAPDPATCPPTLDVSLSVVASSPAAIDAGNFRVVVGPNLGAGTAGRHLGRFADLLGKEAEAALCEVASTESRLEPDCLHVEIVYMPDRARAANVAIRPTVRTHELVLGTAPGVTADRVVPLNELLVRVEEGRFRVRWPAARRDVIAVQGHMLNARQAPPAVRLLLEIAAAGRSQLSPFSWGPSAAFPFLPRVQYGRIVLALAQWRLNEVAGDKAATDLAGWRERWRVPREVYLAVGDNRLLLDLDDSDHVQVLEEELRRLRRGQSALVQEALPAAADAWLPGTAGGHICEVVVPVALRDPGGPAAREPAKRNRPAPAPDRVRLRPPGSDWLFLKLYGSRSSEDELIGGPLRSFGLFATAAGLADGWYFVRYADTEPHLRVRFHGDPQTLLGPLLREICAWAADLVADGARRHFAVETYEREVERYGGEEGIRAAETVFMADSVAAAETLNLVNEGSVDHDRPSLAVITVDSLLGGLGLGTDARADFYRNAAIPSQEDGDEYRRRKRELRALLGSTAAADPSPGDRALDLALRARNAAIAPAAELLDSVERAHRLHRPRTELWRLYIHLHLNRLLGTDPSDERLVLQLLRRTRTGLQLSDGAS